jgi:hypothetical protein
MFTSYSHRQPHLPRLRVDVPRAKRNPDVRAEPVVKPRPAERLGGQLRGGKRGFHGLRVIIDRDHKPVRLRHLGSNIIRIHSV